ncbi:phosphoribosyltransferase family protein [Actinocatenispora sera]|uniref:Phosphoribosyltransferase n=1 Tax=Actinocatenispora sera TaxID=390989 RepID=A0A810KX28_9ACTN|nr:phosphoribosyltransferase family protein [Actinocatenispora sera]BCJ26992.1 phosphoribosyltransferase [Actinocatenispora sera]
MRSRPRHRLAGPVVDRTYRDRREAGAALAALLGWHAGHTDVVVLGLARGGMPVAAEVAGRLGTPLDVLVVRKLGVPWAPEVAFGAIGPDEVVVFTEFADRLSVDEIDTVIATERDELARQDARYHADHPAADLSGRTAVLVDDGLATGATARAAVEVARRRGATTTVLGVPVAAPDAARSLATVVDELVCPYRPENFDAVGRFYQDFRQISDAEVHGLLS